MDHSIADQLNDEEIFTGQLTLKEVQKHLSSEYLRINRRQTVACVNIDCEDDTDSSLKIIETHSAPDICLKTASLLTLPTSESTPALFSETFSDWELKPDDSFLKLEQMMSKMSTTPESVRYDKQENTIKNTALQRTKPQVTDVSPTEILTAQNKDSPVNLVTDDELNYKTPLKVNKKNTELFVPSCTEQFSTPCNELKTRTPIFKTPGNPSHKKQLVTPRKYQNIVSPVATYIRNSQQVPLIKNVSVKKHLPGVSSIPKPVKQTQFNKENIKEDKLKPVKTEENKLPVIAYRNAKETKVIELPPERKMPQNYWAKQVASSIPKAMVVKHTSRDKVQTSSTRKPLQSTTQESFGDLSLDQADMSVCTQKLTFSKPKKYI